LFINATSLRAGMVIKFNNELHSIFAFTHRTPGNLRAFVQVKMRNLRSGSMFEHRFASEDKVEKIALDEQEVEFLYREVDTYHFMNTETYEQYEFGEDVLGEAAQYLTANLKLKIEFYEEKPVGVELPAAVAMKVIETEPGLKGATVSNVGKPAKMESGLVVQVPAFINEGEVIRVSTTTGEYLDLA
jgi:elongation factor P